MKKIFILFIVLLSVKVSQAQLTLTKAFNGPVSGNVSIFNYYDSTTAINKTTGLNKLWNFSSVISSTNSPNVTTYTTVSSIVGAAAAFPTANLARFNGPIQSQTTYDMIKSNPTNEEVLGTFDGTPANTLIYTNSQIEFIYPFTYGSSHLDVTSYTQNGSLANGTISASGVGTGTIILPGNITLTNCLQIKSLLSINMTGASPVSGTLTRYDYYTSSQKFPVVTIEYISLTFMGIPINDFQFSINNNALTVNINENINEAIFNLFPNPTKDKIMLTLSENTTKQCEISIHDVTGKLILKESINNDFKNYINVEKFEKGIYFITIDVNGVKSRKKFIKD